MRTSTWTLLALIAVGCDLNKDDTGPKDTAADADADADVDARMCVCVHMRAYAEHRRSICS